MDGGKADDEFTPVRLPLAKVKKEIKQEADIKPALDSEYILGWYLKKILCIVFANHIF